ncbi:lytic transglycosylase domain-containing protein, partial [Kitasatospora sp. NPDC056138]
TQIKWAYTYMNERYGSPNAAWSFWAAHHWY